MGNLPTSITVTPRSDNSQSTSKTLVAASAEQHPSNGDKKTSSEEDVVGSLAYDDDADATAGVLDDAYSLPVVKRRPHDNTAQRHRRRRSSLTNSIGDDGRMEGDGDDAHSSTRSKQQETDQQQQRPVQCRVESRHSTRGSCNSTQHAPA